MVGLIFDASVHYLDHLAPLCALQNLPLFLCDPDIALLAKRYYPGLEVIESPITALPPLEKIVSCTPRPLLQASLFYPVRQTTWLPHGHSDKTPCFEVLKEETAALVYGEQMKNWVRAANPLLPIETVGNFRLNYFLKHHSFYTPLLPPKTGPTFLYAPTWDDYEKSNTFWNCFPILVDHLPTEASLWVKLHPNTYRQFPDKVEIFKGRYGRKNVVWIEDFPPIYPLLSCVDAYIGDTSSIGYDFLAYDKPLVFLNNTPTRLSRVGLHVKPENAFRVLAEPDTRSHLRKALYRKTFTPR